MSFKNYLISFCFSRFRIPIFFYIKQLYIKHQESFLIDATKAIYSHKNRGKINNFILNLAEITEKLNAN